MIRTTSVFLSGADSRDTGATASWLLRLPPTKRPKLRPRHTGPISASPDAPWCPMRLGLAGAFVFAQSVILAGVGGFVAADAARPPPPTTTTTQTPPVHAAAHAPPVVTVKTSIPVVHHAGTLGAMKDTRNPHDIWEALVEGNARYVDDTPAARHVSERRHTTAGGQHPGAMVLSCADSRVAPELLFDQDVGDLFVVRVAGNVADPVGVGSLEYAAEHLGSKVLVVLGHEKCGAVTAALSGEPMPSPALRALVSEITPGVRSVEGTGTGPLRVHEGVETNVRAVAEKILADSSILQHLVQEGRLLIVPAVYDVESGSVHTLAPISRQLVSHAAH